MHAQIGDQHAGAHVHRGARLEQRLAEARRFDLDHVIARLRERQADHLERTRVAALQLGQIESLRAGVGLQQRQRARLHTALDLLPGGSSALVDERLGGEPLRLRQAGLLGTEIGLVEAVQLVVPGQHLRIGLQALDAHRAAGSRRAQIALHMAQGERQHRRRRRYRARIRRIAEALDDPERSGRELGDGRRVARAHLHRERAGVREHAPCGILQARWQLDRVGRVLGHPHRERDGTDLGVLVVLVEDRRDRLATGQNQPHLLGQLAIDRRGKPQHERADRQAGCGGAFTLAAELGLEGRTHAVAETLLDACRHAGVHRRRDATPPHQAHRCVGRQRPRAGQHDQARLALGLALRILQRTRTGGRDDALAQCTGHDPHRQPVTESLDLAPGVGRDAAVGGGTVDVDQEVLVFLDRRAVIRLDRFHRRPAGAEAERAGAGQRSIGACCPRDARLPVGPHLRTAAHSGRQRLFEVEDPVAIAGPEPRPPGQGARAGHRHRIGQARVAEGDDRLRKRDRQLPHLRHLALRTDSDDRRGFGRDARQRRQRQQRRPPPPDPSSYHVHLASMASSTGTPIVP